ncbi:MAG TPA: alpha/beta hydrolase-fold protein [Longimicrobium sp.]|nr:alpha/beta hydrolase-fold protein [Longimicrobium sp.]
MRMMMKTAVLLGLTVLAAGGAKAVAAQDSVPPHATFTIDSRVLGETRRITVYTPPGYAGHARYPVLYMPDGGVGEDFPHVAATVDAGIRAGEMRRMIVVGIENTERRRDMTGPTEVAEDRTIAPRVGGSAAFRRFIADELMPEVRRRYRVSEETAIIGESLAGLFVVETFFAQPALFDTYIALSPSLWWNGGDLVTQAGERLRTRENWPATVYLSSADEDNIAPAAARLAEAFRDSATGQVRWQYVPRPDLTHATIYRSVAPGVLRELFAVRLHVNSITSPPGQNVRTDTSDVSPLQRGSSVSMGEAAGAFQVMREASRASRGGHGYGWATRIHLSYRTPDRRVNVVLTDDGNLLEVSARSPGCAVCVNFLQYGVEGDDRHLFSTMREGLRVLVERCGSSMDDPAGYSAQLAAQEADFPRAMAAMKAAVFREFGQRSERCNPPGPDPLIPGVHPCQ